MLHQLGKPFEGLSPGELVQAGLEGAPELEIRLPRMDIVPVAAPGVCLLAGDDPTRTVGLDDCQKLLDLLLGLEVGLEMRQDGINLMVS